MDINAFMTQMHSIVTLISFITFVGIVWWTYGLHRNQDFDAAARLTMDDDQAHASEDRHG